MNDEGKVENVLERRFKKGWVKYQVADIKKETHDTITFHLIDADEGKYQFDYLPGQYLTFRFDEIEDKPLVRSYTLSSSPCQKDFVSVTVKAVEKGIVSNWLTHKLQVGQVLRARGPIGKFALDPLFDLQSIYMVAGGSGVTPFISIIREYLAVHSVGAEYKGPKLHLLVSYRGLDDIICQQELNNFMKFSGIEIKMTLTREKRVHDNWKGRIDQEMLRQFFQEVENQEVKYMTCGPDAIMHSVVEYLRSSGVDEQRIYQESFES